jgi:hypothetical protein
MVRIILLLGFGAVLLALVALLVSEERLEATLACDRASGYCALTQRELTRTWNDPIPIAAIDRAEVRVGRRRGGSPQVWVVTRAGDYYFASYNFRSNADRVADQINAFLGDPSADAHLALSDDERVLYWLAWAFVPLIAGVLVVLARVLFRKTPPPVRT